MQPYSDRSVIDPFSRRKWDSPSQGYDAIQSAIDYIEDNTPGLGEGPCGTIMVPHIEVPIVIAQTIKASRPLRLVMPGPVQYVGAGPMFLADEIPSADNKGWHIDIAHARAMTDWDKAGGPLAINESGTVGIELRCIEDSFVRLGHAQGFSLAAIYGNCTMVGWHVQGLTIEHGVLAYNGAGVLSRSLSAAGSAFQANMIRGTSIHRNAVNIGIDPPLNGVNYSNTTQCLFETGRIDLPFPSNGKVIDCYGNYNEFRPGFVQGVAHARPGTFYNILKARNNQQSGLVLIDDGYNDWGGNMPQDTALPMTHGIVHNVIYPNTHGVPVQVSAVVNFPPGSECALDIGRLPSTMIEVAKHTNATSGAMNATLTTTLMPGRLYRFRKTGANLGAVTLTQAT